MPGAGRWLAVGALGARHRCWRPARAAASSNQQTASTSADTSTTAAAAVTTTAAPTTTTTTLVTGPADLGAPSIVAAQTVSAGGTTAIDPTLQAQIADAVHTYVNAASGTPLGTGQAAVLDGVLTAAAAGRLTAASRDALTDEGLPPLAGVKTDHTNVAIDAFVGPDQSTVVNATIDVGRHRHRGRRRRRQDRPHRHADVRQRRRHVADRRLPAERGA